MVSLQMWILGNPYTQHVAQPSLLQILCIYYPGVIKLHIGGHKQYKHMLSLKELPVKNVFFGLVIQAKHGKNIHLSSNQNPVDTPLYWLFNRDPYDGLLLTIIPTSPGCIIPYSTS